MHQQNTYHQFPNFTQPPPTIEQSFQPVDDSRIDKFLIDRHHLTIQRNKEKAAEMARLNVIQVNLNNLIKQQQRDEINLRNNVARLSPSIWEEKINLLNQNQIKIAELFAKLETLSSELSTRKTIKRKRRNKRKFKKAQQHTTPESSNSKVTDEPLKQTIACDLEESYEKYEVDRLRAANLKRINECKRQLALLDSLVELRCIRLKSSNSATSKKSGENHFIEQIHQLKSKWTDALTKYNSLENEIKMLSTHTSSQLWVNTLFSNNEPSFIDGPMDFRKLVDIRKSWDLCLVTDENVFGSSIPPGWVLPNANPSVQWASYLVE